MMFPDMYKIVCSLISRHESQVFREPVNWKELGLFDYRDIVKNPMDLGTIKTKIENNKYSKIDEIAEDIRLVWYNCMLYNRDGSEYYHLADKFAKGFEHAYTVLRRMEDTSHLDINRMPTLEEKMSLSHDLFKIGNNEIARALTIIETSCPGALSRKVSSDEVLINVDALTPSTFHEVNSFVMSCILNGGTASSSSHTSAGGSTGQKSQQGKSNVGGRGRKKKKTTVGSDVTTGSSPADADQRPSSHGLLGLANGLPSIDPDSVTAAIAMLAAKDGSSD
jgi:hypothetical protein